MKEVGLRLVKHERRSIERPACEMTRILYLSMSRQMDTGIEYGAPSNPIGGMGFLLHVFGPLRNQWLQGLKALAMLEAFRNLAKAR